MARRYARDSKGRFSSGGSSSSGKSRPAPKQVQRGTNRLTRDNAGKITGVGKDGATARGGRLRTAAGNKRATTTAKIKNQTANTVKKPKSLKADKNVANKMAANQRLRARAAARSQAGASKTETPKSTANRPRVRGNFRPKNLYTGTDKSQAKGYGTDAKANISEARRRVEAKGAKTALKSNKRSSSVASVNERTPNTVDFNASHPAWKNPKRGMIKSRRTNELSTSSPHHYAAHELGHIKNPSAQMAKSWDVQLRGKGQIYADADKTLTAKRIARRVSKYAMTEPAEFVAETSAALSLGKKFDSQVMKQFRQVSGRKARSIRSQLKRNR